MKRNIGIETYRVALMFGICLLHSITQGCYKAGHVFFANVLLSCVVGFVFISGWFGIRFRWLKLLKLYGIGVYCALAYGVFSGGGIVKAMNLLLHDCWFLHAYALMMCFAPIVNLAVDQVKKDGVRKIAEAFLPLLVVVWCWGFGLTLPIGKDMLPVTDGLDVYGGITLLGIYAAARLCRECSLFNCLRLKWVLWIIPVLWALTGIGLGDYNSPFAFALAACMFVVFGKALRSVNGESWFGRVISFMSPSMFSVYLLHTHDFGFSLIKQVESILVNTGGVNAHISILLTALVMFVGAFLLDLPRRLAVGLVGKFVTIRKR